MQKYSKGFSLLVLQTLVYAFGILPPALLWEATEATQRYALNAVYIALIVGGFGLVVSFLQKDARFFFLHAVFISLPVLVLFRNMLDPLYYNWFIF